jgi:hypothetical protein
LLIKIFQASVNHETVAEGLSEALFSISQNVIECSTDLSMFRTPSMMQSISELYSLIFLFLSSVMDWLMRKRRKRLLDSFNENLLKTFDTEIKRINEKSAMIRNLVAQSSRAEIRATRLDVEELGRDVRLGLEGDARHRAEMEYWASRIDRELQRTHMERTQLTGHFQELTAQLMKMLQERAFDCTRDQQDFRSRSTVLPAVSFTLEGPRGYSILPATEWKAEDIAISSAALEDYFHRDRVRLVYDTSGPITASQEMLQRLTDWTADRGTSGRILWLDGPAIPADDLDNPLTMVSSQFIELAVRSGVPITSYHCELRRGESVRSGNPTSEVQAVLSLVFALVRQMVELLLPVFSADADLSEARFGCIDGTAESWNESIAVLRDLAKLIPENTFCVVDGLHWIDGRSSEAFLKDLLKELRNNKLKVLFTTTGRSPCLREEIQASETLCIHNLDTIRDVRQLDDDVFRN